MRRLIAPLPLLLLASGVFTISWAAFFVPADARHAALNVTAALVPWAAAACAWSFARKASHSHLRRPLRLLAAGTASWGVGQAVRTYHESIMGTEPFPSFADVGFLAAAALLTCAVLSWPGAFRQRPAREWVAPVVLAVLASLAAFELLVEPLLSDLDSPASWLALAYPVLDLVMLASVVLVFALRGTLERNRLFVLGAAVVAILPADAGLPQWSGTPLVENLAVPLWSLGFALVGVAAVLPARLRKPALGAATEAAVGSFVAILIALVMVKEFTEDLEHDRSEAVDSLVFGLVIVVLIWLSSKAVRIMQRTQDELAHESTLRAATMEASSTGNCLFAVDGVAAFRNAAFNEILGFDDGPLPTWSAFVDHLEAVSRENAAAPIVVAPGRSVRCSMPDGRFVELRFEEIDGGEILVSVDDITHREREASTRARFVAEIVGAQDAESRRIAGLLHDDAVQQLTALGLRLELAAMKSGDETLTTLAATANHVTASLRLLLVQLHPVVLESQGLSAAIGVAADPLRRSGVTVDVEQYHDRHPIESEQLAYRLVQEAFANALKHARATHVTVSIAASCGDVLSVVVADDGDGFDVAKLETAVAAGHLGLHLVRERVDLAGGSVEISSVPGAGTSIAFSLPVTAADDSAQPVPAGIAA